MNRYFLCELNQRNIFYLAGFYPLVHIIHVCLQPCQVCHSVCIRHQIIKLPERLLEGEITSFVLNYSTPPLLQWESKGRGHQKFVKFQTDSSRLIVKKNFRSDSGLNHNQHKTERIFSLPTHLSTVCRKALMSIGLTK